MLPTLRLGVHLLPRAVTAVWKAASPTELAYKIATLTEINGALIRPEDFYPYLQHMAQVDVRLFVDMLAAAGRHSAREVLADIDVPTLIEFITRHMTLEPGDLISTGTPSGVGNLSVGDIVEVEIAGIGILKNPVAATP